MKPENKRSTIKDSNDQKNTSSSSIRLRNTFNKITLTSIGVLLENVVSNW